LLHIPLKDNYNEALELIDINRVVGFSTIHQHSQICNEKYQIKTETDANAMALELHDSDINILEQFIRDNPLLKPKTVRAELLKKRQKFKKQQVIKKIQEVRSEIFSKDPLLTFTPKYCALDNNLVEYNLFKFVSYPI